MHCDDDDLQVDVAYATRQRERDENYRRDYQQWIASLPPDERRQVKAMGLDHAYLPSGSGGAAKDAAESSRARCEAIGDDDMDGAALASPQPADDEDSHALLRRLVGELTAQSNARLSLECLALVTGLVYEGDSMTAIAKRHGVTRAAVSKRCVELTQALHLKPSRAMRSLTARQSYRQARLTHLRQHS